MKMNELHKHGINLPMPLPPTPELIQLLQTHIQKIQAQIERMASDAPDYNRNRNRHMASIALLKSIIAGLQFPDASASDESHASHPSHSSHPTDPKIKKHPESGTTLDHQQQSCGTPAVQSGTAPVQPGTRTASSDIVPLPPAFTPPDKTTDTKPPTTSAPISDESTNAQPPANFTTDLEVLAIAEQFHELVDDRSPLDQLAEPPPIGLNLRTSPNSLTRFKERCHKRQLLLARQEQTTHIENLIAQSGDADAFLKASAQMLEGRLLRATADDTSSPEHLQLLIKALTTLRRQTLAERKQNHAERTASQRRNT